MFPSESMITKFDDVFGTISEFDETLCSFFEIIRSPRFARKIQKLRFYLANGEEKRYRTNKKKLLGVTLAGVFREGREDKDLTKYSGLVHVDLDKLQVEEVERYRKILEKDPFVLVVFVSASGRGLKVICWHPLGSEYHEQVYWFFRSHVQQLVACHDEAIDDSVRNLSRLCFVSHDPSAYLNLEASPIVSAVEDLGEIDLGDLSSQANQEGNADRLKTKSLFDLSKHTIFDGSRSKQMYAIAVLDSAVKKIRSAQLGEKHKTRLCQGRLVGGLVAAGHLNEAEALSQLVAAALANTDNASGAEKDVRDGFEDGKKSPVDPPPMEERASSDLVVKIAKQLPPPTPVDTTTTTDNDDDDWADPEPLIVKTDPKPYPIESLPPIIKDAVLEVAEFVQAPVPIVASSALAAIATVAQGHFDVRRAEGLSGPISLFCLAIADSGDRKTSAARFSKTIQQHEKNERERLAPEWKKYQGLMDSWESKRQGLKQKLRQQQQKEDPNVDETEDELVELQQSQPEPPRMPRWQYQDFTIEALSKGMMGWPAAVIESDESGSVFGGVSMREAAMKVLADLNRFWDGNPIHVDRRQSESYLIDGVRLSVSLMIQEPALREFFRQSKQLARGTGFLARFLISWPSSMIGQRFYKDPPKGWPALSAFHQRMEHLLSKSLKINKQGSLELTTLELDDQAHNRWIQFHDDLEQELGPGRDLQNVRDIASKTPENAVRIAANFHAFTSFGKGNRVGRDMMNAGANLALWHLYESQRFFNELAVSPEEANAITLDAWMVDRCRSNGSNEIPRRELQREGPVRKPRDLEQALLFLSSLFRCRAVKDGKKLIIQINPALLEGDNGTK